MLVNARVSQVEADSGRPLMNLNHALYSFAYAGGALVTGAFRESGVGPVPIFAGMCVVLVGLAFGAARTQAGFQAQATPRATPAAPTIPVRRLVLIITLPLWRKV